MKQVLIVDDETIVRITLRTLIDWESFGYQVAADAVHGRQALRYLDFCPVDLIITDMKMPVMDGLSLIDEIHKRGLSPQILVLSGYDDFKLVREAFRMGAQDYLLKADLDAQVLETALTGLKEKESRKDGPERLPVNTPEGTVKAGGLAKSIRPDASKQSKRLADMAVGKIPLDAELFSGDYVVVQFEIEDYLRHAARFSDNLEEELVWPFLNFACQIPRVASGCVVGSISPSRYVMLYFVSDRRVYEENLSATLRRLCSVWKNYMNLPVCAGVSSIETKPEAFMERLDEAGEYLKLRYLKGKSQICAPWEKNRISYSHAVEAGKKYQKLIQALFVSDELVVETEKSGLFASLYEMGLSQAVSVSLCLICCLAWKMEENHDDIRTMFSEEIDYYKKLKRFHEIRELELWLNNYFRWFLDYQNCKQDRNQKDMMMRAKGFIMDNYSNPELTLGSVAGYVGLNEKYFSSRFTKEEGMTFSNYLTEVRIRKARELMDQTSLKIYEISQSVGYNSVEHFTRVFKKLCGVSPGNYRTPKT